MNLIISFAGRKGGNCDLIAQYISDENDKIIYLRDCNIHGCVGCNYECFHNYCKYHDDDIYNIYNSMLNYQKIFLIVPMYCGNPSSLYFVFNERCQDFFMHNEDKYEDIIARLYIIGIYGSKEETPDFIPCFEKWFSCSNYTNHVLGIERHKYNSKMTDSILDIEEVKDDIQKFLGNFHNETS